MVPLFIKVPFIKISMPRFHSIKLYGREYVVDLVAERNDENTLVNIYDNNRNPLPIDFVKHNVFYKGEVWHFDIKEGLNPDSEFDRSPDGYGELGVFIKVGKPK